MIWIVLKVVYLAIDWVVNAEDEEPSDSGKKHEPLGNKVKLFEFSLQQGSTTPWIAGTCQHRPLPWPLPCHDLIVVNTRV